MLHLRAVVVVPACLNQMELGPPANASEMPIEFPCLILIFIPQPSTYFSNELTAYGVPPQAGNRPFSTRRKDQDLTELKAWDTALGSLRYSGGTDGRIAHDCGAKSPRCSRSGSPLFISFFSVVSLHLSELADVSGSVLPTWTISSSLERGGKVRTSRSIGICMRILIRVRRSRNPPTLCLPEDCRYDSRCDPYLNNRVGGKKRVAFPCCFYKEGVRKMANKIRGHGEGSIHRRRSGKWRAQITQEGIRLGKTFRAEARCSRLAPQDAGRA